MEKKRVLMLLPNGFDPDPRVHHEARSLVGAGYDVTILCWDRELKHRESDVVDGIKIERIFIKSSYGRGSSQMGFLWKFWKEALRRAPEFRPDLIHAHDFNTLPLGWKIGKKLKIPVIFDAHESYHEMLEDNVHPLIKWGIAKAERYFVKRIDLLITVGSIIEEEYKIRGARKTVVVGNWKRLDAFRFTDAEQAAAREQLRIPPGKLVVSYVGYFDHSRILLPMIEAVRDDRDVFLVLGGKGRQEKEITAAMGGAENILFLGYTPPARVPLITAVSDVSYYGLEGNRGNNRFSAPNKLFEALAAGNALLTGNLGEIGKITRDENCGVVLDNITRESVSEAFKTFREPGRIAEFKENSRRAGIEKYNWAQAEKKLFSAYAELFAGRA